MNSNKKNNSILININTYYKITNKLFTEIEKEIDIYQKNFDIDYESYNNLVKINFKNINKIIINCQETLRQIWMATNNTGYHFEYNNKFWICNRTKKQFWIVFKQSILEQLT